MGLPYSMLARATYALMVVQNPRIDNPDLHTFAKDAAIMQLGNTRNIVGGVVKTRGVATEALNLNRWQRHIFVQPDIENVGKLLQRIDVILFSLDAHASENIAIECLDDVDALDADNVLLPSSEVSLWGLSECTVQYRPNPVGISNLLAYTR